MRRYFVEQNLQDQNELLLTGDLFHHIIDVCRQGLGSQFELLTPESVAYFGKIISLQKKQAIFEILESRHIKALPRPHIHLAVSVPKFPTYETILEKAVELGVHSVHPFFSDFSFIRTQNSWPEQKSERWKKIVIGATQQSGRGELMKMLPPQNLPNILALIDQTPDSMCLFAYEGEAPISIKDYVKQKKSDKIENIWILVGSEGGFSDQEVVLLNSRGHSPVTLGEQVLRVETACLALVSALKYEFDLLK